MAHIYHCLNEVSVHIIIIFSFILAYWSKRINDTRIHIQNCEHWTPNNEHTAHTTIQLLESHLKRMNYTPKRKIKTKRIEKPHWKGKTRADSQTMRHTQITMVLVHMHDKCVCDVYTYIYIHIYIYRWFIKQASKQSMYELYDCSQWYPLFGTWLWIQLRWCVFVHCTIYACIKRPTKIILFAHRAIWCV